MDSKPNQVKRITAERQRATSLRDAAPDADSGRMILCRTNGDVELLSSRTL